MKVFLNDRMVEFVGTMPDTISPRDLVVQNPTADSIKIVYEEFERNEKWGRMLIINSPSDSFFRLFKRIDAAGGLVKNEKGEFLFIHRFGLWDLPKGKIDKKDQHPGSIVCHLSSAICHPSSAYNAAVREVKEETGLQSVIITKELPSTWHIYSRKGKKNPETNLLVRNGGRLRSTAQTSNQ
ncbi:MAG: NUDIX domain-containing protein [Bacteroidales bacterium]|nr:NUDIX domain-containing protein [Bacteroidales bacterium]